MNKKGWKRLKKVVLPAFGWVQQPKAGRNTQHNPFPVTCLKPIYLETYSKINMGTDRELSRYEPPMYSLPFHQHYLVSLKRSYNGAFLRKYQPQDKIIHTRNTPLLMCVKNSDYKGLQANV